MSNVPTNLIPTRITGLPEYLGSSTLGYMPYIIDGRTYKVQFANIAAVGAVPSTREINTGSGLGGGGDLSANRTLFILPGGVDDSRLTTTGVAAGTYGAADSVPVLTVNAQGRVTAATSAPIVLSNYVPTSRTITAGTGLTGGGDLSANRSFAVNFSSTTPEPLGPGSPGVSTVAARGDHVHPAVDLSDTTETQGVLPLSRGGTGNSLSPVAGAIVYSSNDKLYLTTAGSIGQVLRSGGPGGVPFWTNVGAGTVTSVAVATANGLAGTVANATLTPIITLSTTVTGVVKGDGTALSAATAGTDYVAPGAYTTSGLTMATARLLGRTTASVGAAQEITVGTGLTLASGSLVNAAPDQVVSLTSGTAISVTGTYPSFTVTNTAPDQVVSLTAGTAISVTGTYPSFSVTNTAPDQVVSLTGAGTTTVTGTYPSFTITSNDSTAGTVTSVNASGGTTGMSFTGGPITSAGTLTLNGTLAVSNGGTGATDAVAALTNLGAYPASNPSGFTSNVGTVTSVSGTGTVSGLSLSGTVTSAGSLTLGGTLAVLPSNFASQTANTVLAAPNGSAGTPTFRAIVAADIPTLNQNTTGTASNVTGIVAVANGGTGASVAATARTNLLAAGSGANTDITSIALTTGTISTSPVNGTDIVNKAYADSIASGINFHQSVRLATAAALPANTYNNGTSGVGATLTANANGALSVDGVAVVAGNRILVKDEVAGANNGVYVVTQVGSGSTPYILTRATDFDSAGTGVDQIDAGDFFLVTAGSTLSNTSWVQQTPLPITVGTTPITFTQFAAPVLYSAGTGLTLAGTVFSITNTGVAASTYGSASSVPVIAVNAQGQLTSASSSAIAIAASQITSGALAIANGGTGATSAATALTNLGAYPASNPSGFTSNTGTVTSVNLTAGTGVSVSGGPITASGSITVTNTAPDQVVSLTGSGATTVTGTYPNFTISSPASGAGTVTSINVSGGTTGLTTSGGPVTTSGTITLAGTLNVANGGTGATTLSSGYVLKGNGTSAVSASVIYDDGTNVGIGTTLPVERLRVEGNIIVPIAKSFYSYTADYGIGTPDSNGLQIFTNTADVMRFGQRAAGAFTERARIDSSGNLGLGTSSPAGKFSSNTGASGTYVSIPGNVTGWDATASLFGAAGSSTGAAVAIGMTAAGGYISSLAPSVAWQNLYYQAGTHYWYNGVNQLGVLNTAGDLTAIGSMRAPIFYDSNDTAYYADFAGSTAIFSNGVIVAGTQGFQSRIVTVGDRNRIWSFNSADGFGLSYFQGTAGTGGASTIGLHFGTATAAASTLQVVANSYTLSLGSMRSPIFYDSDNTGFFIDAASTSSLITLLAQNLGVYDSGVANDPYGKIAVTRATDANYSYYGLTRSGQHVVGMGIDTSNQFWIGGLSANGYNSTRASSWLLMTTSGNVTAPVDMRAPIFYDSNDTSFYGDFGGASRFNSLLVTNGAVDPSNIGAGVGIGTISEGSTGFSAPGIAFGTGTGQHGAIVYGGNIMYFGTETGTDNTMNTRAALNSSGTFSANGDFRAPIFYDSANTAYYGDFASTSEFNTLQTRGGSGVRAFAAGSASISSQLYFADAGNTRAWNWQLDESNNAALWNYDGSSWTKRFTFTSGSNLTVGGAVTANQLYAQIFYDSQNGAYYVDPASTSNLNVLQLQGSITTINGFSPANSAIRLTPNLHLNATAGHAIIVNWDNGTTSGLTFRIGNGAGSDVFTTYANGAVYASIIYDISDSAYYIDPNSTSRLNNLQVGGTLSPDSAKLSVIRTNDGSTALYVGTTTQGVFIKNDPANATTVQYFSSGSAGGSHRFLSGNTPALLITGDYAEGAGSLRAPIFYDSNNTFFYMNLDGYSQVNGFGSVNGSAGVGMNIMGDPSNGAIMAFHRSATYAVNMGLDTDNVLRIGGWSAAANRLQMDMSGNLTMAGNVTAFSDVRLKKDIETIDGALDLVSRMRGVRFTRIENDERNVGVVAQEMLEVLPEVVQQGVGDDDTLSVAYGNLVGVLIEAIKELEARVAELEGK